MEEETERIEYGSIVTLSSSGGPERYQVVRAADAAPMDGRISDESPLGRALLGHRAGELVRWSSPGGANAALITGVV